jgi:DNA-binding transcriptional LysR family regulator
MELLSLKTFKAVVDEEGIKGASIALHTVPSNISMRIQKLEDELKLKLFKLSGRQLEVTPLGRQLYEYARQILQLEQQARTSLIENHALHEITIGTTETFAAVHLPSALKKLKLSATQIKPKIHTATSGELIKEVLNNKIDCAFVGSDIEQSHLLSLPIIEETLVFVEPIDQQYDPVLIVRDIGCGYRKAALTWQYNAGRTNEEVMTMSSVDGVLGCIAAGLGYTVISSNMLTNSRYESSLLSRPIHGDLRQFRISLICRKDTPLIDDVHTIASLYASS